MFFTAQINRRNKKVEEILFRTVFANTASLKRNYGNFA